MINLHTSTKQLIKVIDKKTNKDIYYLYDNDGDTWKEISQNEYNDIRGIKNGK